MAPVCISRSSGCADLEALVASMASVAAPSLSLSEIYFSGFPINLYCCRGTARNSLLTFAPTRIIDPNSLDLLLHRCSAPRQVKQIHALIFHSGYRHSPFLSSRLVSVYSRLSLLNDSISVFLSAAPPASSLQCNSILRALLFHKHSIDAISLYRHARSQGTIPDGFTFPLALRACTSLVDQSLCVSIHAHAVASGFQAQLHVANQLICMYSRLGQMDFARKVFDRMTVRNVISWNTLVSGYALNRQCEHAVDVFETMRSGKLMPNQVTWTSLVSGYAQCLRHDEALKIFNEMRNCGCEATAEAVAVALSVCPYAAGSGFEKGKEIHGFAKRSGIEGFIFVRNSLVCMYGKFGHSTESESLFSEVEEKDLVSWNALISSYAASGCCYEAYEAFCRLQEAGEPEPNVVSWSAVIGGFASCGELDESLDLFRVMQRACVQSNAVTLATVLSACAELSSTGLGREIHAHSLRGFMYGNLLIQNGLLNMYIKGGSLKYADLLFERMKDKDLITWNSMIYGHGVNGSFEGALNTFRSMVRCGVEPDGVTFVAVLSACTHTGQVAEGRKAFALMFQKYGISPGMEHYACMVDLLGRAGHIREARELVDCMPMRPNACIWGSLLNSCRMHGNTTMAENTASRIWGLDAETSGNCMLISNIYAATGRWEDSARVRVSTREKGMRKNPGLSWIEVKKNIHVFTAGGSLPSDAVEAYDVMVDLNRLMENKEQAAIEWLFADCVDEEY